MSYHESDEEQIELLKGIWKDYGQPVVLAVAISLAAVSGYRYWNNVNYEKASAASALYQNLLDTVSASQQQGQLGQMPQSLTEEQKATVSHVVASLQDDYSSSRYAQLATLFQAQQQVKGNDLAGARISLQWVLDQKPEAEVKTIASVRLARVLLSESDDNAQQALDVLSGVAADKSYESSIESVKGDAYLALEQFAKARESYQKAVDSARDNGDNRPLLQLKLDDLAAIAPLES